MTADLGLVVDATPTIDRSGAAPQWLRRYTATIVAVDLLSVVVSTVLYAAWGDAGLDTLLAGGATVLLLTIASMLLARAWAPAALGQGTAEFARLLNGMAGAAVTVGLASLALDLPQGRPWAFGVIPLAAVLAGFGHKSARAALHRRRQSGEAMRSVLAVGTVESVAGLVERTRRARHEGLTITAACVPGGMSAGHLRSIGGIPVLGDIDDAERIARAGGFDAVSVGRIPGWSAAQLRGLAWGLESTRVELVVDPGLMEIAGPRLHTASIDGMPLLQLTQPRFTGLPRVLKACFDRVAAVLLLVVLAPLFAAVAVAVALDGGPVFFRQTRVGLDGREFRIVKFRSTVVDAEARQPDLRLTRIGAVLRRHSLDDVPQLINVVAGSMSLVGPRPPLPREVAGFERAAQRRLLVKPGMTGLWQVSGRSDLSWEESVRLDLRYVENWTFALDLQILASTIRSVRSYGPHHRSFFARKAS